MLIPKFSVRWLLILTAVCAGLSLIIAAAVRGRAWALAFSLGVGAAGLTFFIYAAFYTVSWLLAVQKGPAVHPPLYPPSTARKETASIPHELPSSPK